MRQIVDHFHVSCQTDGLVTQIHCPFHSNDANASARIYETGTMYCFVCNKVWDAISFVKEMKEMEDYSKACLYIEENFGITRPNVEEVYQQKETLTQFLDKMVNEKQKSMDFERNFTRISEKLVTYRGRYTLRDYSRYFNFFDNLYASYKMKDYEDDASLKIALDGLYQEISKGI